MTDNPELRDARNAAWRECFELAQTAAMSESNDEATATPRCSGGTPPDEPDPEDSMTNAPGRGP